MVKKIRNPGYGQSPGGGIQMAEQEKINLHVLAICLCHIMVNKFIFQYSCLTLYVIGKC